MLRGAGRLTLVEGQRMTTRWRVQASGPGTHVLERLVGEAYVVVGHLDPHYAQEVEDVLNAVPVAHLQKQVGIMADQVEDILARVIRLGREVA
jgi:hypothetical protein